VSLTISGRTLLDRSILDDPYPFYRNLQSEAPVWRVPGTDIFVVTRFALLEDATRRVEEFSSNLLGVIYRKRNDMPARLTRSSGLVQALATADPPFHAVHKKAVFPDLVAKRMLAMTADIEQVTEDCVSRLLQSGTADFMRTVGNLVPITVVSGSLTLWQLVRCLLRSAIMQHWIAGQLNGVDRR
jgi:cytochrome P450